MSNPNENRTDPGFNNIQTSAAPQRAQKQLLQKYTILTALAIITLIVAMLLVMAIGGIIQNIAGKTPGRPDNERVDWATLTVAASDTLQGPLVLVNQTHAYTFPAANEHLEEIYAVWNTHKPALYQQSGLSTYMEGTALHALDAMLTDFAAATGNTRVQIRDAYRSAEDQKSFSIPSGYSDHHTGYGCSLKYVKEGTTASYEFENDPEAYAWILDNCHKYGFVRRYPADKVDSTGIEDYLSYFRYVGVPHATYMKQNNLCMEEYIALLHDHTNKEPLKVSGADGKFYEIYYVAVLGSADVKYPTNYAYTLSGTNEGGVVVTVDRTQAITPAETDTAEQGTAAN